MRSGVSYPETLILRELARFKRGVIETEHDRADIANFQAVTTSPAAPSSSDVLRFFTASVLGNLVGTLVGGFLAFQLAHWQERKRAREEYARLLSAVRYELSELHSICEQAIDAASRNSVTSYEVEAPALTLLVSGAALQAYAPHGLTVVLRSLAAFVGTANTVLNHFRLLVALNQPVRSNRIDLLRRHLERLRSGIANAETLIDRELARFKRGVIETEQDRADIANFQAVTTSPGAPSSSDPPRGSQAS